MPLNTTPGDPAADSYASRDEATAYCGTRLYTGWTAVDDEAKDNLLRWAVILLDAYPRAWTGAAASDTQALRWPRTGMKDRDGRAIPSAGAASIPLALKRAQAELAWQLNKADKTGDNAIVNLGITSLKAGSVSLSFGDLASTSNSTEVPRYIREVTALAAVLPDAVKYLLVPSWLSDDPEKRKPLLLEVM